MSATLQTASTEGSAQSSLLLRFRHFAKDIRQPRDYRFGESEIKGLLNIFIGVLQLLPCPYFKYSNPHSYRTHLEGGKQALSQGARDLCRAIITTAVIGTGLVARKWTY